MYFFEEPFSAYHDPPQMFLHLFLFSNGQGKEVPMILTGDRRDRGDTLIFCVIKKLVKNESAYT